jgi:hypothetical protein
MKIIGKNKYGRAKVADILIAENVDPTYAWTMADHLNGQNYIGQDSETFFNVERDDYVLWSGEKIIK